ncbi:rab-37 [Pristionchus pacificus]|uniref:Rab-37 n=1 Tax=Pristionchus pacificus TaxID=54126 RepID=A0A2A6D2A5_PRIPA|nr:rab-37 [Pristionchus pacificus]|eukprot:PDM84564.1 rab-37 [Pristionchus pacificus]
MDRPPRKKSSMNNVPVDFSFTVMLLGDSCTGKTCVLVRFKDGTFLNNNFISTVGIDYRNKIIPVDGKQVKLQIFDTAGQERFRSVTSAYYRDADALLLVFDVANRLSFENIRNWLGQIKDFAKDNVMVTLIGNKCDLAPQRKVTIKEAQELAQFYQIPYLETSAKTGQRINEAFILTARRLMQQSMGTKADKSQSGVIDLVTTEKTWGQTCCYEA